MSGFIRTFAASEDRLQDPFDVAVVMPTILRPGIVDALRSVFAQTLRGRIQVLIGIDKAAFDLSVLETICDERPPNCAVQVFYPGYSTSVRHGGISQARDGGVLRCVLTYLANSRYVAYLDDDNWWRPDHLTLLRRALDHADWACSLRWFVHPTSRRPICVDRWESVGAEQGAFNASFGGFVDANCLMLNKVTCESVLPLWNRPLRDDLKGMSADRNVFDGLHRFFLGAGTNQPTVFYTLDPSDERHAVRLRLMGPAYEQASGPEISAAPGSFTAVNVGRPMLDRK